MEPGAPHMLELTAELPHPYTSVTLGRLGASTWLLPLRSGQGLWYPQIPFPSGAFDPNSVCPQRRAFPLPEEKLWSAELEDVRKPGWILAQRSLGVMGPRPQPCQSPENLQTVPLPSSLPPCASLQLPPDWQEAQQWRCQHPGLDVSSGFLALTPDRRSGGSNDRRGLPLVGDACFCDVLCSTARACRLREQTAGYSVSNFK